MSNASANTAISSRIVSGVILGDVFEMFAGPADALGFYNPGGWGPAIIANFPPLIWFLVVGVVLIRQSRSMN